MMILSFIIPVYNTREYVEKCIRSILSQNLDKHDYEIIIVNDGSTDNSSEIIEKVVEDEENIKIINQINKGLGAARNVGLEQASGKYVFFVDSDDYILPDTLNFLIDVVRKNNSDIIGFNWKEVYSSGKTVPIEKNSELYDKVLSGAYYLNKYNLKGSVWSYVFFRSFLEEFSLSMPEGIYHEDELFLPKTFTKARNVFFIDKYIYAYLQRENSITTKKEYSFLKKRISDSIFVIEGLLQFQKGEDLTNTQKTGLQRKIDFLVVDIIINLVRMRIGKKVIYDTMERVRDLGLFPLRKKPYSKKYSLFRALFKNEKIILWISKLGIL